MHGGLEGNNSPLTPGVFYTLKMNFLYVYKEFIYSLTLVAPEEVHGLSQRVRANRLRYAKASRSALWPSHLLITIGLCIPIVYAITC